MYHCDAIAHYRASDYGFEPVYCGQVVGVRTYSSSDGLVGFCPIEGHQANVRRRFSELGVEPPEPRWLHEDPEYGMGSAASGPPNFGSQVAMRGDLPKDVAERIDAIESADPITMSKAAADR